MKKTLLILTLLIVTASLSAQNFYKRGFALGADRDTLLYIIASPFDNWYINVSGGVQTFIGNEPDNPACWNTANLGARVEIGKWIIPDLAVSLRFGIFHNNSQTRYAGNNPWVDTDNPIIYDGAQYGPYYSLSAHGLSAVGLVTLDWTNFLSGFEAGIRKKWHISTPLGLGGIWLYNKAINPTYITKNNNNGGKAKLGDIIWNKELTFVGGLQVEYIASPNFSFNMLASLAGARGSLDDYNYYVNEGGQRRADLIPSLYVGLKFNLIKQVTKYNIYDKTSHKEKVNHEFLTVGSWGDIERRKNEVERLNNAQDSLLALIIDNNGDRDDLIRKYDSLADVIADLSDKVDLMRQPANLLEDLLSFNERSGLPSVIVYFQLDKYDIDFNGHRRLQNFAIEANRLHDSLRFYLIGAADSATGSIPHNVWLSERRCEAVYNALVGKYNVQPERIIVTPVGGITDYEPQEYNRMGMVILRTPETEKIVERWLKRMREQQ